MEFSLLAILLLLLSIQLIRSEPTIASLKTETSKRILLHHVATKYSELQPLSIFFTKRLVMNWIYNVYSTELN